MRMKASAWIWLAMLAVLGWSCGVPQWGKPDERLVQAHSSGLISPQSVLTVVLQAPWGADQVGKTVEPSPFVLSPSVAGQTVWADAQTIEFRPSQALPLGQSIDVAFRLPALDEKSGFASGFNFAVQVKEQTLEAAFQNLKVLEPEHPDVLALAGELTTNVKAVAADLEKCLRLNGAGSEAKVQWTHDPLGLRHSFVVTGLKKNDQAREFGIGWDGSAIQARQRGEQKFKLPGLNDFVLTGMRAVEDGNQYVELGFSQPLAKNQDLRGLIRVDGHTDLKFAVDKSTIKVYSSIPWVGPALVKIEPSLQNAQGKTLEAVAASTVNFTSPLPEVKFLGKGTILPTSQGLTLPFETINLNSVMVEAFQIYGEKMPQFLQVNTLDGSSELRRVGKVVWKAVVPLGYKADQADKAVRRGLDLSPLTKKFPNGMFRLRLSFQRPHVEWNGTSGAAYKSDELRWTDEAEYRDRYDGWYDDYDENQRQKNNPFHLAFYHPYSGRTTEVYRNVLISDLGLMAKRSSDNSLFVFTTNLKSGEAKGGVAFKVLDYQGQVLFSGSTDKDGIAAVPKSDSPYLLVATADGQTSYLRVDDGTSLSVSHFEVDGSVNPQGVNGFIYGERGVWRPGDDIYLTFILLDPQKTLPANHPVAFELINPAGQSVKKLVQTAGVNGFYDFKTSTAGDAPTGTWTARVSLGGRTFDKPVKIETIMPNRLKIDLKWNGDTEALTLGQLSGTLASRWLTGAPAAGLKADINVNFAAQPTTFGAFKDFLFDDPAREFKGSKVELFNGNLSEAGEASINPEFNFDNSPPGRLKAFFTTRVYEPSGTFSSEMVSADFNPYPQYVGMKPPKSNSPWWEVLYTNTDQKVQITLVNQKGEKVSGQVKAELLKINWHWWWESGEDTLAEYVANQNYKVVKQQDLQVTNGVGEWNFNVKGSDDDYGRYLIRIQDPMGGHSTGKIVYMYSPYWKVPTNEGADGASVLTLTTDKPKYSLGETVNLSIPTNPQGKVLVSLEVDGKIVQNTWLKSGPDKTTNFAFKTTADMAPNFYAHVTFLQPHLQSANDLPIRLYGIQSIAVDNPDSHLQPLISSAETFKPESSVTVTVKEKAGRPMTYTLAMVDEGLLGITAFKTQNPWDHFYKKVASLVKGWDLYDAVIGAYSGQLDTLLAIGGDGEEKPAGGTNLSRFKPVVKFFPAVNLAAGESKIHTIDLPPYVGEVRLMVVAGSGKSFGIGEKSVPVKSPLMILPTLPRLFSPNENFEAPVTVFAYDPSIKEVNVSVAVSGPVEIDGSNSTVVNFASPGDALAQLKLKTRAEVGPVKITFTAKSGAFTSSQTIEGVVRLPAPPITETAEGPLLNPGESWNLPVGLAGIKGTVSAQFEASRIPPIDLTWRLNYLIHYPYGCIEQTTSSVFPQLFLDKLVELTPSRKLDIQDNVTAAIARLGSFQTVKGGFSYWPGQSETNPWGSNYAGHFLTEARKLGYAVPTALWEGWKQYQHDQANLWNGSKDAESLDQAYRLFTLALAESPDLGAMNRLRDQKISPVSRWYLAAAYALSGQKAAATALMSSATFDVGDYRELGGNFGSSYRDKAVMLDCLTLTENYSGASKLLKDLSQRLSTKEWESTQTTAYALLAVARYAGKVSSQGPIALNFKWNNANGSLSGDKAILQQNLPVDGVELGQLAFTNTGKTPFTPKVIVQRVPGVGTETAAAQGLSLKVEYLDSNDKPFVPLLLKPKTDLTVQVTVTNTSNRRYEQLVLNQYFPTGWEIQNARLTGQVDTANQDDGNRRRSYYDDDYYGRNDPVFDYQDIRDDRVFTFFSLRGGQSKTFKVLVTNTYRGSFYLPMTTAEAMYDNSIRALVPGKWITIGDRKAQLPSFLGGR